MPELDQATFRRVEGVQLTQGASQLWDMIAPAGHVFARAEIFEGESQWGVRLQDKAPDLRDEELLKLVSRMLVWEVGCRADTVEVVLSRNHERHMLVRVGADYV